ncbi:hypothetical protein [Actinoplanes sp. HUAS TT8]|uniref:hypothetical protein n=1 Tax=Actinoplanes sp. HUAS TT8 TaxID=3447453 RepID=UPI003F529079
MTGEELTGFERPVQLVAEEVTDKTGIPRTVRRLLAELYGTALTPSAREPV